MIKQETDCTYEGNKHHCISNYKRLEYMIDDRETRGKQRIKDHTTKVEENLQHKLCPKGYEMFNEHASNDKV